MNFLSKINPIGRNTELDVWRPATRWDPIREMEDMMRGMQRMLGSWPARTGDESTYVQEWSPCVDIGETDQEFLIKAELPEVKKDDIKVTVDDGNLVITGERKSEHEEKDVKFHRVERSYGRFQRSFSLPDETDPAKITSEFHDGILTVHLPKNPSVKHTSQTIPVD